jgi:hypothetical protein
MIVKGKRTEVSHVDVEIDIFAILENIRDMCIIPHGAEYLSEGKWYKEDFFDYHKRESVYCVMREATEEELELFNAFSVVLKHVRDLK